MNKFNSCALIYNPKATKFNEETLKRAYLMIAELNHGADIKFCKSEYPGHLIDLVKENNDRDLIITLGGDGTVSEAYKAFGDIKQNAIYAHLSVGTTNDMATNFNLYKNKPLKSLEKLLTESTIQDVDMLKMNDKTFAYISAFGYLAHVPFETNPKLKKKLGHLAYVATAAPDFTKIQHLNTTIEIDGKEQDTNCFLGMISNFVESAGVKLHPYADPTDGIFEVLLLKKITPKAFMEIFPQYLMGKIDLRKYSDFVDIIQTDNIKFTFHDLPNYDIDNDGDKANADLNEFNNTLTYQTDKKIKILMPNGKR